MRDELLTQAEAILSQRLSRSLVIDKDVLGEPGWDILLCAYIAYRQGVACAIEDVAGKIELSNEAVRRWIHFLASKNMLVFQGQLFSISEEMECKISQLFRAQVAEIRKAVALGLRMQQEGKR